MFLKTLNVQEKKAFLELAHVVAVSNGIINEVENKMIEAYAEEMGIGVHIEDLDGLTLESIIPVFTNEETRRIAFVEAIAIALSDGDYELAEQETIDNIRKLFGFSVDYYEAAKAWIKQSIELYQEGQNLIYGSRVSL